MAVTIIQPSQATATLKRMAYQIWERNYGAKAINLVGISKVGHVLSTQLAQLLGSASPLKIYYDGLFVAEAAAKPDASLAGLQLSFDAHTPLVLVDDVLYTGKTLFAGLRLAAQQPALAYQVAVLLDRGHRSYPISPDFVGMRLATTLQEYVRVAHGADGISAFLE